MTFLTVHCQHANISYFLAEENYVGEVYDIFNGLQQRKQFSTLERTKSLNIQDS